MVTCIMAKLTMNLDVFVIFLCILEFILEIWGRAQREATRGVR